MNLPSIDLSSLPQLDAVSGAASSLHHAVQAQANDETVIILMTFLWDIIGR